MRNGKEFWLDPIQSHPIPFDSIYCNSFLKFLSSSSLWLLFDRKHDTWVVNLGGFHAKLHIYQLKWSVPLESDITQHLSLSVFLLLSLFFSLSLDIFRYRLDVLLQSKAIGIAKMRRKKTNLSKIGNITLQQSSNQSMFTILHKHWKYNFHAQTHAHHWVYLKCIWS